MISPPSKSGRPSNREKALYLLGKKEKRVFKLLYIHVYMFMHAYVCVCASKVICSKYEPSEFSDLTLFFCIFY